MTPTPRSPQSAGNVPPRLQCPRRASTPRHASISGEVRNLHDSERDRRVFDHRPQRHAVVHLKTLNPKPRTLNPKP
jgi:hypothetical protein